MNQNINFCKISSNSIFSNSEALVHTQWSSYSLGFELSQTKNMRSVWENQSNLFGMIFRRLTNQNPGSHFNTKLVLAQCISPQWVKSENCLFQANFREHEHSNALSQDTSPREAQIHPIYKDKRLLSIPWTSVINLAHYCPRPLSSTLLTA